MALFRNKSESAAMKWATPESWQKWNGTEWITATATPGLEDDVELRGTAEIKIEGAERKCRSLEAKESVLIIHRAVKLQIGGNSTVGPNTFTLKIVGSSVKWRNETVSEVAPSIELGSGKNTEGLVDKLYFAEGFYTKGADNRLPKLILKVPQKCQMKVEEGGIRTETNVSVEWNGGQLLDLGSGTHEFGKLWSNLANLTHSIKCTGTIKLTGTGGLGSAGILSLKEESGATGKMTLTLSACTIEVIDNTASKELTVEMSGAFELGTLVLTGGKTVVAMKGQTSTTISTLTIKGDDITLSEATYTTINFENAGNPASIVGNKITEGSRITTTTVTTNGTSSTNIVDIRSTASGKTAKIKSTGTKTLSRVWLKDIAFETATWSAEKSTNEGGNSGIKWIEEGTITLTAAGALSDTGKGVVQGTSSLKAGAAISTSGKATAVSSSSLRAAGSISGTGSVRVRGTITLAAGAYVFIRGPENQIVSGKVTLSAGGALSTQAFVLTSPASPTLRAAGSLSATGTGEAEGSSVLSAGGRMAVSGKATVMGSATLGGAPRLTLTAKAVGVGTSTLRAGSVLSNGGHELVVGSITLRAGTRLSASGRATVLGTSTLRAGARLSTTGSSLGFGAVVIRAGGAIRAGGIVIVKGGVTLSVGPALFLDATPIGEATTTTSPAYVTITTISVVNEANTHLSPA